MTTVEINSLVLAYLGDSIYESYVREYLIESGINHVKSLQEKSLDYVSAKSQDKILKELINQNIFTDDEITIMKRARNAKVNSHPKSTDIITYKNATSLEAIFGYLKLENNVERIEELMNIILKN